MNKTITYITNAKEEGAVGSLSCIIEIPEKDLLESIDIFMSYKKYFIVKDPEYQDRKGFKKAKTNLLEKIYSRIISKDVPNKHDGYFPDIYFSKAKSRHDSLLDRNYQKLIFELFNANVFFDFMTFWEHDYNTEEYNTNKQEIQDWLSQAQYQPKTEWLGQSIPLDTLERIRKTYKTMNVVRVRNLLVKEWEKTFKSDLKKIENHYHSKLCELPLHKFIEFYGPNDQRTRKCEYCSISELDIKQLDLKDQIFTKRFYSRGSTMEVDKRDPNKNYEISNLVMSCYWCNNAKTDEFTEEEFLVIAKGIRGVWENRLKSIK